MKVLIVSGSPRENGNTFYAAKLMQDKLESEGIEVDFYNLANKNISQCQACNSCKKSQNKHCIIEDDLNDLIDKCLDVDGLIISSPIHFADISGIAKNAYDRLFFVCSANGNFLRHKVGASFVAVRRSGGIHGFHTLNNYLMYVEMFIASSSYWNIIHGWRPNEAYGDVEGVYTIENLAENYVFLLKSVTNSHYELPAKKPKEDTNFVRKDLLK